jgi:hypothetical protein
MEVIRGSGWLSHLKRLSFTGYQFLRNNKPITACDLSTIVLTPRNLGLSDQQITALALVSASDNPLHYVYVDRLLGGLSGP